MNSEQYKHAGISANVSFLWIDDTLSRHHEKPLNVSFPVFYFFSYRSVPVYSMSLLGQCDISARTVQWQVLSYPTVHIFMLFMDTYLYQFLFITNGCILHQCCTSPCEDLAVTMDMNTLT